MSVTPSQQVADLPDSNGLGATGPATQQARRPDRARVTRRSSTTTCDGRERTASFIAACARKDAVDAARKDRKRQKEEDVAWERLQKHIRVEAERAGEAEAAFEERARAMTAFIEAQHLPMCVNSGPCAWSASTLPNPLTATAAWRITITVGGGHSVHCFGKPWQAVDVGVDETLSDDDLRR